MEAREVWRGRHLVREVRDAVPGSIPCFGRCVVPAGRLQKWRRRYERVVHGCPYHLHYQDGCFDHRGGYLYDGCTIHDGDDLAVMVVAGFDDGASLWRGTAP